jgi:hypothetical protein
MDFKRDIESKDDASRTEQVRCCSRGVGAGLLSVWGLLSAGRFHQLGILPMTCFWIRTWCLSSGSTRLSASSEASR